jgi:hypothetical protein
MCYWADFIESNQDVRQSSVFIIGSRDLKDIIVCSCTKHPARTEYDIPNQLKKTTCERTDKIYTVRRSQLTNKINVNLQPQEYSDIIDKLKKALHLI